MREIRNLTGQRFGKLTVIALVTTKPRVKWSCLCDCGQTASVSRTNLDRGTKSCGCLTQENKQPLTWKIEDLPAAVANVKSWEALYAKLGAGRGVKHAVKRWVRQLDLSTTHFTREWDSQHTLPDDVVFCTDSKHIHAAKRRFYKRTPDQCVLCSQGPVWNRQPLKFQIDHQNGVKQDCRWENLRKICPNCHTQTDTFCGRNRARALGA